MIDGSARRMMKRARTPKEVSGDPTDQRPGYHRTVRNAAEHWGRYADVPPPGMFASVTAVACGFGDDADE